MTSRHPRDKQGSRMKLLKKICDYLWGRIDAFIMCDLSSLVVRSCIVIWLFFLEYSGTPLHAPGIVLLIFIFEEMYKVDKRANPSKRGET